MTYFSFLNVFVHIKFNINTTIIFSFISNRIQGLSERNREVLLNSIENLYSKLESIEKVSKNLL
jgi:hypothetical protein